MQLTTTINALPETCLTSDQTRRGPLNCELEIRSWNCCAKLVRPTSALNLCAQLLRPTPRSLDAAPPPKMPRLLGQYSPGHSHSHSHHLLTPTLQLAYCASDGTRGSSRCRHTCRCSASSSASSGCSSSPSTTTPDTHTSPRTPSYRAKSTHILGGATRMSFGPTSTRRVRWRARPTLSASQLNSGHRGTES